MTWAERMEYLDVLIAALGWSRKVKRGGLLEIQKGAA